MRDQSYKSVNNSQPNNIRGGETNNMKKLLSTLLVFALVLTMVTPAFAATELTAAEKYEALKEAGIFAGTDKGDNLEGTLTRAEVAGIVARLFELEQPAKNPSFSDTEGHWAQNTIEAVNAAGYMTGVGFGKFAPNQTLTFEGLAALLMKVTGLEYAEEATVEGKVSDWAAKAVATVVEAGLMDAQEDYTVVASRADLAVSAYTIKADLDLAVESVKVVDTKNIEVTFTDGETVAFELETALEANVEADVEVEYNGKTFVIPVTYVYEFLAVESVKTSNAKDVVVDFNRTVDDLTAENEANYEIKINNSAALATSAYTATVDSTDASLVKIVLAAGLNNGDVLTIKVKKAITDENLNAMTADYTTTLAPFGDTVAPTIVKTAVNGNDVVVTFDEYLDAALTNVLVKFNNSTVSATASGKELTLLGVNNPSLDAGNYTINVANISDTVGNVANFLTTTLVISKDFEVPTFASITAKGENSFDLKFNKSLAFAPTVTVKKNGYTVNVLSTLVDGTDSTVYNVTLNDAGVVPVYSTNENTTYLEVTVTNIKDSNNTYGNPVTTSVTLSKDKVAPTMISSNNQVTGDVIKIQFNELITVADATKLIITDKDGIRKTPVLGGVTVGNDTRYGNSTVLEITMPNPLATGTYTVYVGAGTVQDAVTNKNAAVTAVVTKTATSASLFTPVSVVANASGDVITVTYPVAMTTSAITSANYKLDGATLPTGTVLYFQGSNQVVVIELPVGAVSKDESYVVTLSENILSEGGAKTDTANYTVVLKDTVKPVLVSAKKLNSTTVELTFSEDLASVPATPATTWGDDFIVKVNGVTVNVTATAVGSSAKKLVLTVDSYNVYQNVTVTVDPDNTSVDVIDASTNANKLTVGTTVTASN